MTDRRIRLVIADDQALVRAGLRLILATEDDLDVVAEAADGEAAIAAVAAHRPDVVLMDVRMPGTDGIAATRRIAATELAPPVLVLTTFEDDEVLWGAVEAGASGFVLKDTPADDLVAAIRVTSTGGSWLDPRVTPRLLARLRIQPPAPVPGLDQLTSRELEVLELMARGRTNQEIAAALYLGERTVKTHVGNVFAKLDARDRAAAIIGAYRAGLVDPRLG
ncbi:MAG: two component transcriptional regulator, LuxR family [Ilumatobacteraceae bacterium]|nr:two component transcriptional regulator, LuxR family [Ilumatobacteraceae bacterium]